jgi:putative membrane protein
VIVTQKKSWLSLVFALKGSTFQNIWPRMLVVVLVALLVTVMSRTGILAVSLTPVPFTVVGLALAIFLGFRNNAA